jgi:L-threonate 2-dehydrogenase
VQRVMDGDFAMRGAVGIMIKDLGAVLEMGREMRAGLPITAAVYQRYLEACAAGLEQADDAAVIRLYERAFGVDVVAAAAPAEPDGA